MAVAKEQITIPKFKTEAEEAAWWNSNPDIATRIMKQALKSGTARRKVALKAITMRLPVADLEAAQDVASRKERFYTSDMLSACASLRLCYFSVWRPSCTPRNLPANLPLPSR